MEACGTSHHWARELVKPGHDVRLMPPANVKPYVKRGKTDANDAEAICEAVKPESVDPYVANLLARKPVRVATVAMANKAARTAWAIMVRAGTYRAPVSRLAA